jgi:hypothetical protein
LKPFGLPALCEAPKRIELLEQKNEAFRRAAPVLRRPIRWEMMQPLVRELAISGD